MHVQKTIVIAVVTVASFASVSVNASAQSSNDKERGKYLIEIGGCNDCHTPGYAQTGGKTPESEWLKGDGLGFRGAWGTTYPVNLREYIGKISESEWVAKAKTLETRPPMPWWALNAMTEDDLIAIYKYIKSLGSVENSVPSYVPPEKEPKMPYIQWPLPPKTE